MNKKTKTTESISVLVACEQSQTICLAFRKLGFTAYSCDILRCYGHHPEFHIIGDALIAVHPGNLVQLESGKMLRTPEWDLIIAHPPCTMLSHVSAVALAKGLHSLEDVQKAACFFNTLYNTPCARIAIENPAPLKIANLPKYTQIIQPYEFGHKYSKRVCLWLRNLPPLLPTCYVTMHESWLKHCAGTPRRRSKTFEGIAEAMASQWGGQLIKELF